MKKTLKYLLVLIMLQFIALMNIEAEYTDSCTSKKKEECPMAFSAAGTVEGLTVESADCYYHSNLGKCIEYKLAPQADCSYFSPILATDDNMKKAEKECNKSISDTNFCKWNNSTKKCEKGAALPLELSQNTPIKVIKPSESKPKEQTETKKEGIDASSCADFKKENDCLVGQSSSGARWGCAWNKDYKFCSPTGLAYLSCGSGNTIAYDIPVIIPRLVSYAIVALKTITPVILIIIGMFQLIKAITSQNDDEMKKAKSSLVKKLIAAVIIFFMVSIVQFVVSKVADDSEQSSLSACMSCFINNDCGKSMYYTDGYGNCYSVATKGLVECPVADY